jgi:hypothetical protein
MRFLKNSILLVIAIFLGGAQLFSQTIGLQGQISGWTTINHSKSTNTQFGLRYIPEFSIEKKISEKYSVYSEVSVNAYSSSLFISSKDTETNSRIKPYRMWIKFSSSQFEIRLGLQKINFGSASLLRPLMWFDRIDPRDPLQMTDGVYGILGRYYLINNANLWLWALYGNNKTKGMELLPTEKGKIEYGGRLQAPMYKGEIGLTYHHRQADLHDQPLAILLSKENSIPEDRLGFDGKWDIGIGLWLEGVIIHQDVLLKPLQYQRLSTIGLDYTFSVGNGIYTMAEYFTLATSDKAFHGGESYSFAAASMSYPLNVVDSIRLMLYYNNENRDWYRFINWQRVYDKWSFYYMGFWNPDQFQIYPNMQGNNLFAGKGFQVMVVFNY